MVTGQDRADLHLAHLPNVLRDHGHHDRVGRHRGEVCIIIACCLQLRLIVIFHSRFDFNAYCIFSLVNTIVYAVPAGWLWAERGFLYRLGVVDIAGNTTRDQIRNISLVKSKSLNAGSGGVHLVGGASALVSAWLVGPRLGRWQLTTAPPMGSPTNALIGLYMLWWGWLAFNAGSTFGVRDRCLK